MISLRDSPIYRQKSKDASGHEHDSGTGQFTSGGGGSAKPENKLPTGDSGKDIARSRQKEDRMIERKREREDAKWINREAAEEEKVQNKVSAWVEKQKDKIYDKVEKEIEKIEDESPEYKAMIAAREKFGVGTPEYRAAVLAHVNWRTSKEKELYAPYEGEFSAIDKEGAKILDEAMTRHREDFGNRQREERQATEQKREKEDQELQARRDREDEEGKSPSRNGGKGADFWVKSKDASGHEHSAETGQFTSGSGGSGKSEGKLFKTRKGAGEASPEIKQAALETIKRDLVAHGRNPDDYIFGDEAIQRQAEKEPFPARVSAIARDIIRANTTKDEDVVARHDTVRGHTSLFTVGHSISSQTGSEPHAQGAGYRGRRGNVKIPHDATDEKIARLVHRANGYKLPDSLQESSGKPANNLPK